MDERRRALREALSRLLAAASKVDGGGEGPTGELAAALEQAAKALVRERARSGRPWVTTTPHISFLERWRRLRQESIVGLASGDVDSRT
jgi:hypothetical protein